MKIEYRGYEVFGTPAEIIELVNLSGGVAAPDPDHAQADKPVKPVPKPKRPADKPAGKKVDWAKAAALRKAGWSYDKIGEELGVSGVTVSTHLNMK